MNLFEPQPDYASHDTFLFALLGIAGANEAMRKLILQSSGTDSETADGVLAGQDETAQQLVDALLGLVCLSELSQDVLRRWAKLAANAEPESTKQSLGFDGIDDVLR